MITTDQINDLVANGATVFDAQGDKIGSLGQIYLDDQTGQPSWLTVNTGLFGMSESFVPLDNATVNGDEIHVGYSKDQVKDAPKMDPDGHLDPAEEDRLYAHYGQAGSAYIDRTDRDRNILDRDADGDVDLLEGRDRNLDADRDVNLDRDVDLDRDDASMVRSEERLNVGTEEREAGKVRLRKYVVTENVQQTVPVSREEVHVERVPLNEGDAAAVADRVGDNLGEEEVAVTLHEERPVVSKETVPVEEVRLSKETVTGQETVSGEVRREEITTEGDERLAGDRRDGNFLDRDADGDIDAIDGDRRDGNILDKDADGDIDMIDGDKRPGH